MGKINNVGEKKISKKFMLFLSLFVATGIVIGMSSFASISNAKLSIVRAGTCIVSGRLTNASTGASISSATIFVYTYDFTGRLIKSSTTTTDSNGYYYKNMALVNGCVSGTNWGKSYWGGSRYYNPVTSAKIVIKS